MFEAYAHGFGLLTALSALIGFALVRSKARSSGDEVWHRRERLVRSYMWGAILVYLLLVLVAKFSNLSSL